MKVKDVSRGQGFQLEIGGPRFLKVNRPDGNCINLLNYESVDIDEETQIEEPIIWFNMSKTTTVYSREFPLHWL